MSSKEIYTITGLAPVAYYRFESGALTTDSSGNSHTLTAISDPAGTTGVFGGGVVLDGNDAYSAVNHADFRPTGNFTIFAWIKTSSAAQYGFFQSHSSNTNYAGIFLGTDSGGTGVLRVGSGKNTGTVLGTDRQNADGVTNICDNVWHFCVGTWDGSYLRVYVDGNLDNTAVAWANAPAYAATNYVRVGCRNNSGTDIAFFTGSMDDCGLLNGTALSAEEIKGIYIGWKKYNGLSNVSLKTINGLAVGSISTFNGI